MSTNKTTQDEKSNLTVTAIFAHPDDELSCAGTMANHVENGDDVHLVFMTKGENITNIDGTTEEIVAKRKAHTEKIENLLGVKVHFMDFPDSKIEYNMEGAYKVARKIRELKPDIILTWNDRSVRFNNHPDHTNTGRLVLDAITYARLQDPDTDLPPHRKPMNIFLTTELSSIRSPDQIVVDISHQHKKVLEFIEIYKEAYGFPHMDFIMTHIGRTYGLSRAIKYGEAFEIIGVKPAFKTLPAHPGFEGLDPTD